MDKEKKQQRIKELFTMIKEDQEMVEKIPTAKFSLLSMDAFFNKAGIVADPSITIDDSGLFHCSWRLEYGDFLLVFSPNCTVEFSYTFDSTLRPCRYYQKSGMGFNKYVIENELQGYELQGLFKGEQND